MREVGDLLWTVEESDAYLTKDDCDRNDVHVFLQPGTPVIELEGVYEIESSDTYAVLPYLQVLTPYGVMWIYERLLVYNEEKV